jgi:hypothetical protein
MPSKDSHSTVIPLIFLIPWMWSCANFQDG